MKRCTSCCKAFPNTHEGIEYGLYWLCCKECNDIELERLRNKRKPKCFMCQREITSAMATQCFKPNGEDRINFCSSRCGDAHTRGYSGWTICDQVAADVNARRLAGQERYGKPLDWSDGRDYLTEAYEEALDMCVYLKALLVKREEDAGDIKRPRISGLPATTGDNRSPVP